MAIYMPKQLYLFAWYGVNIGREWAVYETEVKLLAYVLKDPSIRHCNVLIAMPHRHILRYLRAPHLS